MNTFIKTKDSSIADELKQNGFVCLGENNGVFTFVVDDTITFSNDIKNKIIFTNKLDF